MGPKLRAALIWITMFTLTAWIPALAQQQLNAIPVVPTQGIMTNTGDMLRGKQFAKVINNLQMTKQGVWTSRGIGWTRYNSTNFSDDAGALGTPGTTGATNISEITVIYGQRNCQVPEVCGTRATTYLVFAVGTDIVAARIASPTVLGSGTVISNNIIPASTGGGAGTAAEAHNDVQPCMRSYSQTQAVFCVPESEPLGWGCNDSTAASALAGWPVTVLGTQYSKPKYCEPFATRMAYAGFPSQPNNVLLSKASTHNTFTTTSPTAATDAGAFQLPMSLGPITGMKTIRIGNTTNDQILVVGCRRGIAFIGGSDATNFYSREYTRQHGLISNRGWVQIQNDLYYPATDGLRTLASLNTQATLAPDTVTFGINNLWQTWFLNVNTMWDNQVFAVHHPGTQEIWFYSPGSVNGVTQTTDRDKSIILNYNTSRNSDGTIAPIFSTRDGVTGFCGTEADGSMYIGRDDGYIASMYSADDNNGTYIQWQFMPALIETNAQNPLQSSSSRRFLILTEGPAQSFTAEAYAVTTDSGNASTWKQLYSQQLSASAQTVTDLSTWATSTTTTTPHIIEFDPTGNARYWGIRLKAAQSGDHINLVGITQIQIVGGTRQ